MQFIIWGDPPRVTAQEKGVYVNPLGKPVIYEKPEVKRARRYFECMLYKNRPAKPMDGAIFLKTIWTFDRGKRHKDGEWKITKPDTDNLLKLFKDCMTKTGFWHDDSQVAYEVTIKRWGEQASIEVMVSELDREMKSAGK